LTLVAAILFVMPAGAAEKTPFCAPASVERGNQIELSGTLYREPHFGPPGYGEHPRTDRKDRIAILRLDAPMRVNLPLTDFHEAGIITVKEVQIVPAKPGALDAAGLSGKHVVIKGQLFEPNGDDHVRDILIFAASGQVGGRIACNGSEQPRGK
jgi:hypothetical protein